MKRIFFIMCFFTISTLFLNAQKGGDFNPTSEYGFREGLSPFNDASSGLWGYMDKTGKTVIPAKYYEISPFSDGLALVATGCGYMLEKDGEMVMDEKIYFVINKTGKTVFNFEKLSLYYFDLAFHEGLANVTMRDSDYNEYQTFIDTTGKIVSFPGFNVIGNFSNGLALFQTQDETGNLKYGYIDRAGKVAIPAIYDNARTFSEGAAFTTISDVTGSKSFFIDVSGKKLFDTQPFDVSDFSDGLALIWADESPKRFKYLDKTGKETLVITKEYYSINEFFDGLAKVSIWADDGLLYGYIDKSGKEAIPPRYKDAGNFSEGLAPVFIDGKIGFIDKTGKFAIKPKFEP